MSEPTRTGPDGAPTLEALLARHRPALVAYLERHAAGLARFESAEDLAQGVHLHALRVAHRFRYLGEGAFLGWVFALARQHVADRNAHWKALKRNAGPMLRITYAGASTEAGPPGVQVPISATGPSTFAYRRELLQAAAQALDALSERDAQLVRMMAAEVSIGEIAEALAISPAAAQRARHRAIERFRAAFEQARRG